MPEKFSLDTIFIEGKDYETPKRLALIIGKIGTDATSAARLNIDNKPLGDIITTISPLHRINTNLMPLLCLKDLYYVVPPETKIKVEGPSGCKIRAKGDLLKLAPGEVLPAEFMSRFAAQPNHYLTYVEKTYSHGTDVKLVADAEVEVISLTPKTIEKYMLAHPVMAAVSNYTPAEGDLGVRFYLQNVPKEEILKVTKVGGIDLLAMPRPPKEDTEFEPFTLEGSPIEVPGDWTLSIKVRNTKGADISPAAGTSLTFTITAICKFWRKTE